MTPQLKRRPKKELSRPAAALLRVISVLVAATAANLLGPNGCARRPPSPMLRSSLPSRATADLAALERLHPLYAELQRLSKFRDTLRGQRPALRPGFEAPGRTLPGVPAPAVPMLRAAEVTAGTQPLGEALSSEMMRLEAARRKQMEQALAQEEAELRADAKLKLDAKRQAEEEKAAALEELAVRAARNKINRLTIRAAVQLDPDAAGKSERLREEIQQRNAQVKAELAAAKEDLQRLTDQIEQACQQATAEYEREIQTALKAALSKMDDRRRQLDEEFAEMRREQEEALKSLLRKPPPKIELGSFSPGNERLTLKAEVLRQAQAQAQSDAEASVQKAAERLRASLAQIEAQRKALRHRINMETETAAEAAARQMGHTLHGPLPQDIPVPDITHELMQELQADCSSLTEP